MRNYDEWQRHLLKFYCATFPCAALVVVAAGFVVVVVVVVTA